MQHVTPQRAVAFDCCPTLGDLDWARHPHALLAHAGPLGHAVDGVHCGEHVDADAALRINGDLVGGVLARTQTSP